MELEKENAELKAEIEGDEYGIGGLKEKVSIGDWVISSYHQELKRTARNREKLIRWIVTLRKQRSVKS